MSNSEINIQEVLKYFRELVGMQAQEIAILKATLDASYAKNNKTDDKVE
jgi:hypothetical protein